MKTYQEIRDFLFSFPIITPENWEQEFGEPYDVSMKKINGTSTKKKGVTNGKKSAASKLDPMEAARDFLKEHGQHGPANDLKLRYWRDEFHAWNGRRYLPLPEPDLRARLISHLDESCDKITRSVVGNVLECLKAEALVGWHQDRPRWLGDAPHFRNYVAMANGLLDLDAAIAGDPNCLLPHSPLWFSPVYLDYDYDPAADCPTWKQVIAHNLEHDQQRINLAQEWAGYCLTADTSMQKFMLVTGEGANGKSVFFAAITGLLGSENVSNVPLEMFGARFPLHQTLGKLANIAAEVGELDKVAEGALKSFTAGDRMMFERKFKDGIEAAPTARLMLATNSLPRFADRSGGIWRRMLLMPFRVTIGKAERIHGLDKPEWWAANGELPGLFNWALDGLKRLRSQGRFTESAVCEEALDEYRVECNPARQFLLDQYTEEKDPLAVDDAKVITADVYRAYRKWCESSGYHPLGERLFGKEIIRAFPSAKREKLTDNFTKKRAWGYTGIRERTAQDESANEVAGNE